MMDTQNRKNAPGLIREHFVVFSLADSGARHLWGRSPEVNRHLFVTGNPCFSVL